jgi:hypothetical protein
MPAHPTTITRPDWQSWRYDPKDLKLRYQVNRVKVHEIDLTRGSTSAAILDALFELETKPWASPKILDGAARALKDLLNPAADFSDDAKERSQATGDALRREIAANIATADRVRDDGVKYRR